MGTLHKLAPREPMIDRKQMAELIGVSLATLDRMVAVGMPSRKYGNARRFEPAKALAWLDKVGPTVKSWRDAA